MNVLIAIVTCKQNSARRQALLDTWVPLAQAAGYDVEFFEGDRLGVPDDYVHLPLKAKAIFKWALDHNYDRVLKVDDDVYVKVDTLKPPDADYAGANNTANDYGLPKYSWRYPPGIPAFPKGTFPNDYICGGAVWFSRKAIQILVDTPLNNDFADDRWVGQVMASAGIPRTILPFHWGKKNFNPPTSDYTVVFDIAPEAIRTLHQGPPPEPPPPQLDYITVIIRGKEIRIPKPKTPKYEIVGQTERARRRGRR